MHGIALTSQAKIWWPGTATETIIRFVIHNFRLIRSFYQHIEKTIGSPLLFFFLDPIIITILCCLLCTTHKNQSKQHNRQKGKKDINIERTEEALAENPQIVATGCPFCNTMMTDGVKHFNKNTEVAVKDIVELIAEADDL